MSKRTTVQYVAITAFGSPNQDNYIAPGEVVNRLMEPDELEHYLAVGCITVKGAADDPNTWSPDTPTPRASTVTEIVTIEKVRLDQEPHASNVPHEVKEGLEEPAKTKVPAFVPRTGGDDGPYNST